MGTPLSLEDFYKWCISQSSSPNDKYQVAWTAVEKFIEQGGKTTEELHNLVSCK